MKTIKRMGLLVAAATMALTLSAPAPAQAGTCVKMVCAPATALTGGR